MNKSNWWSDAADRAFIVKKLGVSYYNFMALLDGDVCCNILNKLVDKTRDKLDPDGFYDLYEHAVQVYTQIAVYNALFEMFVDDKIKDNLLKAVCSPKNMKSYAERVVDLSKTLKELDVTEIDEVKEVLPVLKTMMYSNRTRPLPDGTVVKIDPRTEFRKASEAVAEDIVKEWDSFSENIHNKILVDEVETKLNELS